MAVFIYIEKLDWYEVLSEVQDTNLRFALFYEKLQSLISQVVPLKLLIENIQVRNLRLLV